MHRPCTRFAPKMGIPSKQALRASKQTGGRLRPSRSQWRLPLTSPSHPEDFRAACVWHCRPLAARPRAWKCYRCFNRQKHIDMIPRLRKGRHHHRLGATREKGVSVCVCGRLLKGGSTLMRLYPRPFLPGAAWSRFASRSERVDDPNPEHSNLPPPFSVLCPASGGLPGRSPQHRLSSGDLCVCTLRWSAAGKSDSRLWLLACRNRELLATRKLSPSPLLGWKRGVVPMSPRNPRTLGVSDVPLIASNKTSW